jgi:hypothetical protein
MNILYKYNIDYYKSINCENYLNEFFDKIIVPKQKKENITIKILLNKLDCLRTEITFLKDENIKKVNFEYILKKEDFKNITIKDFDHRNIKLICYYTEEEIVLKQKQLYMKNLDNQYIKWCKLNNLKRKAFNTIDKLNKDYQILKKKLDEIKINYIKYENKNLQNKGLKGNRSKIDFYAELYIEKEINKTLNMKDFMLASDYIFKDYNYTGLTRLSKIMYKLRKSNIIWESIIIFKDLYSFQYIQDYQINYLIKNIEKIIDEQVPLNFNDNKM